MLRHIFTSLLVAVAAMGLVQPVMAGLVSGAHDGAAASRMSIDHAGAGLVAFCAVPAGLEHRLIGYVAASLGDDVIAAGTESPQLLLRHDGQHYDIIYDNGSYGQWSLRQAGAEVSAMAPSDQFVQVMVRQGAGLEQYLFRFQADGEGVLMWAGNVAADVAASAGQTGRAACRRADDGKAKL